MTLRFDLDGVDGAARAGRATTARGSFTTPCFMPVGTRGAVRTVSGVDLEDLGAQLVLANTYHLMLRPGIDVVAAAGGLHRFTGWPGHVLTDSGGYQVFSMEQLRRISEEGVEFRSHIDGSLHFLSPEKAVEVQVKIGRTWRDILSTRSDRHGLFKAGYRFTRTHARVTYRFRAVIRTDSDYPYTDGRSNIARVRLN